MFFFFWRKNKIHCDWLIIQRIFLWKQMRQNLRILKVSMIWRLISAFFFVFWRQNKIQCDWLIIHMNFLWKQMRQNLRILKFPIIWRLISGFSFLFWRQNKIQCDSSYKGIFWGNKCAKIWQFWNYLYLDNRFLAGHQNITHNSWIFIFIYFFTVFSDL